MKARVIPQKGQFAALIGGSLMTLLSSFHSMWITKADFEEVGPNIVHRKCTMRTQV